MPARIIRFAVRNRYNAPRSATSTPSSSLRAKLLTESITTPIRDKWTSKHEFFLSCVGYAIGLGNVWRFPYLCYQNGGGAFLLPYLLTVLFCGMPLFILEATWGQMLGCGVGIASLVMNFWLNVYYVVLIAWSLYYLVWAIGADSPWDHCNNKWNTEFCRSAREEEIPCMTYYNVNYHGNISDLGDDTVGIGYANSPISTNIVPNKRCPHPNVTYRSSAQEFWEYRVLNVSKGIEHPGGIQWELAVALAVVWMMSYFCIFRGVKLTGKVVYFTALFPYAMLALLLLRSASLPGAIIGLKYYLQPDFSKLGDSKVWIDAVTQVFYSYGLGCGVLTALGSHNPYKNNVYKQSLIICCVNTATSIAAGIVVFATIGYMAYTQGMSVKEVAHSGPGLIFVVYPSAVRHLSLEALWMSAFFLMLIFLGLDSHFCQMEGFITALIDQWPGLLRGKYRRELLLLFVSFVSYIVGLPNVTQGGIYIFNLLDYYSASGWGLLWLLFFECIAISWFFGMDRWYNEIRKMIGYYPSIWWNFCWLYTTPFICLGVFIFSLVSYAKVTYLEYKYPQWAEIFGWCLALSSMLCIPGYAALVWYTTDGTYDDKLKLLLYPDIDIEKIREGGTHDSFSGIRELMKLATRGCIAINLSKLNTSPDGESVPSGLSAFIPLSNEKGIIPPSGTTGPESGTYALKIESANVTSVHDQLRKDKIMRENAKLAKETVKQTGSNSSAGSSRGRRPASGASTPGTPTKKLSPAEVKQDPSLSPLMGVKKQRRRSSFAVGESIKPMPQSLPAKGLVRSKTQRRTVRGPPDAAVSPRTPARVGFGDVTTTSILRPEDDATAGRATFFGRSGTFRSPAGPQPRQRQSEVEEEILFDEEYARGQIGKPSDAMDFSHML